MKGYLTIVGVAERLNVPKSSAYNYVARHNTPYTVDPARPYPPSRGRRLYAHEDVERLAALVTLARDGAEHWYRTGAHNAPHDPVKRQATRVRPEVSRDRLYTRFEEQHGQSPRTREAPAEPDRGGCVYAACTNAGTVKTTYGTFCTDHVPNL